jgi:hypothetical protein
MDGEIWDEDQWEAFLKATDRHLDRYMALLFRFMSEDPPDRNGGSSARKAWEVRFHTYLLSNGLYPDASFPRYWDETDDGEALAADDDAALLEPDDAADISMPLERLSAYRAARRCARRVLTWSNALPGSLKDSTLVQFCAHITQISGNLAKGHGIGYEMDMIGGNIACAKRALAAANAALELLREMRGAEYMNEALYRSLYESVFHIRNGVGIYVQELRARFDLGVD